MKKQMKKLQLQKRTVTRLQYGETRGLNGGIQASAPIISCRITCFPTQLCVTVAICPTTTLPTANCPLE
jgi:hypothetical protein